MSHLFKFLLWVLTAALIETAIPTTKSPVLSSTPSTATKKPEIFSPVHKRAAWTLGRERTAFQGPTKRRVSPPQQAEVPQADGPLSEYPDYSAAASYNLQNNFPLSIFYLDRLNALSEPLRANSAFGNPALKDDFRKKVPISSSRAGFDEEDERSGNDYAGGAANDWQQLQFENQLSRFGADSPLSLLEFDNTPPLPANAITPSQFWGQILQNNVVDEENEDDDELPDENDGNNDFRNYYRSDADANNALDALVNDNTGWLNPRRGLVEASSDDKYSDQLQEAMARYLLALSFLRNEANVEDNAVADETKRSQPSEEQITSETTNAEPDAPTAETSTSTPSSSTPPVAPATLKPGQKEVMMMRPAAPIHQKPTGSPLATKLMANSRQPLPDSDPWAKYYNRVQLDNGQLAKASQMKTFVSDEDDLTRQLNSLRKRMQ